MGCTDVDPWHRYALMIRDGDIPSCEPVKQAVSRYFDDLNNPVYRFNRDRVVKLVKFSRLCCHVKGPLRGQPIILEPWQLFILANLFGFERVIDGRRKYRKAYVEVPRKNAKSTLASIIGLIFLLLEPGQNDIYTAAVSRDQARIVFDSSRQMVNMSKSLKKHVKVFQHHLQTPGNDSTMKPLASKANTIEGTNPSLSIIDEYHLHPDNSVYSALDLGMGARPNGLLVAITTAGTNFISACKEEHNYVRQVLGGVIEDVAYFGIIYTLDSEEEYRDSESWIKANPCLGVSVDPEELSGQVSRAEQSGHLMTELLTKRFNIWCNGETTWIKPAEFQKLATEVDKSELVDRDCFIGLDLSSTSDLTAIGTLYPRTDGGVFLSCRCYVPEAVLSDPMNKNSAIYRGWVRAGWLHTTPGDLVDYEFIERDIYDLADRCRVHSITYDRWNATRTTTNLSKQGLEIEPCGQGFQSMSPPAKEFERWVKLGRVSFDGNPVITWAISNITLEMDAAGNIKPNKAKSANKIDPVVALLMAFRTYMMDYEEGGEISDEVLEINF